MASHQDIENLINGAQDNLNYLASLTDDPYVNISVGLLKSQLSEAISYLKAVPTKIKTGAEDDASSQIQAGLRMLKAIQAYQPPRSLLSDQVPVLS